MRTFMGQSTRLRTSLGLTADVAEESATAFDTAFDRMAASARRSAVSISASTASIRREMGATGMAVERSAMSGGTGRSHVGGFGMWGGLGAAAALAVGIKTAASVQSSASQTGVAMGLPTSQVLRQLSPVAMRMSDITAQSQAQSMSLLNILATSGLNTKEALLGNNASLPMAIARYADTQFLGPNRVGFDDSARTAAQIAHQFGARSGAELTPILNTLFKISQDMPDSISKAATQLKYYAPQYINAGISGSEILQLQATADRMGLGAGRSGTGFRQVYQSLIHPTMPQFRAQAALGLTEGNHSRFIQRNGQLNIEAFFKAIDSRFEFLRRTGGDVRGFQDKLAGVTTATGASILNLFGSQAGQDQRRAVTATLSRVPSLERAQAQLMDNVNGQFRRLTTNLETLTGVLAMPMIRPLTDLLRNTADLVSKASFWFGHHPGAAAAGGGLLAAGGAYGVYRALSGGAHLYTGLAETVRVGRMHIRMREGLGGVGQVGEGVARGGGVNIFGRFNPVNSFRGLVSGARDVGTSFDLLMGKEFATKAGISLFAETIGKFGLRAVPVVGEVLLLTDTIRFLGSHSKDIGRGLADATHWIVAHGAPMIRDAFVSAVRAIIKGIQDTFAGLFNGGKTGLIAWMGDAIGGGIDAFTKQYAADTATDARTSPNAVARQRISPRVSPHPRGDATPTTIVNGDVKVVLPPGSTRTQHTAFAHALNRGGNVASTAKTPAAMTNPAGNR